MRGMPRSAWVGLGLLILAAVMLSLGKNDTEALPSIDSYAPSGASAFYQLLKVRGLEVAVDRSLRPKLRPNDVAIAFWLPGETNVLEAMKEGVQRDKPEDALNKPFPAAFVKHLSDGGKALILPLSREFASASRHALASAGDPVRSVVPGAAMEITLGGAPDIKELQALSGRYPRTSLWLDDSEAAAATGVRVGAGTAIQVRDGLLATNRFIDRNQNAAFLLKLLGTLGARRVVFTEAAFGNVEEKGFLETVGAWLDAAWQQLLLLGLVTAYTLGRRLGPAEESRRSQRGSRELVDALADTMRRGKATRLAMETALHRADREIRTILKLPKEIDPARRDELLPQELAKQLKLLELAAGDPDTPESEAVRRLAKVDAELQKFALK